METFPSAMNPAITSPVLSVDPSSTMSHSKSCKVCLRRLSYTRGRKRTRLYVGVQTVKSGAPSRLLVGNVSIEKRRSKCMRQLAGLFGQVILIRNQLHGVSFVLEQRAGVAAALLEKVAIVLKNHKSRMQFCRIIAKEGAQHSEFKTFDVQFSAVDFPTGFSFHHLQ